MLAVIGAGPAGLAAARDLVRAGHEVVVLDASRRLGGWAATIHVAGRRVGLGDDTVDDDLTPATRTRLESLVPLASVRRRERVLVGDRWVPWPPTAAAALRSRVSPWAMADAERHLAAKLAGGPAAGGSTSTRPSARPSGRTRLVPRGGLEAVVTALAADLPDVRLGTKVTGLVEHDDRVIVGLGDGRIITASAVVSTVGATRTASWLGLVDADDATIRTRSMVLVHLVVAGGRRSDVDVRHLPAPTVLPVAVAEPDLVADPTQGADDERARTRVLVARIPCWTGDAVWRADAASLARRVADDLVRSGLPDPDVVDAHVERVEGAVPVTSTADRARVSRAERLLRGSRRVRAVGRRGVEWPSLVRDLEQGWAAAAAVGADGTFPPP